VCATCLGLLECGGSEPFVPRAWRSLTALSALYVVAAAIFLLLFGLVAHYSRKKWRADPELDQHLLDKEVVLDAGRDGPTSPSMTYIHGGVREWRPLQSDREYAQEQQLQPTSTMSTASTGRSPNRKKARPGHDAQVDDDDKAENEDERAGDEDTGSDSRLHGEDLCGPDSNAPSNDDNTATVPLMVDTSRHEDEDIMGVSPIQTREESSSSSEGDDEDYDDVEEWEDDPVFEDFSPRSMNTEGGEEKMEDV